MMLHRIEDVRTKWQVGVRLDRLDLGTQVIGDGELALAQESEENLYWIFRSRKAKALHLPVDSTDYLFHLLWIRLLLEALAGKVEVEVVVVGGRLLLDILLEELDPITILQQVV